MGSTSLFQPLIDRARQAMYAAALVVAIGSLWTIAWANSLDDHAKPAASDRCASAEVAQAPTDNACAAPADLPAAPQ